MRRLSAALGVVVLLAVAGAVTAPAAGATGTTAPAEQTRTTTPIKHFLVLMQENHSFDNYFGTYPGADGIPAATCMPLDPVHAPKGECVKPFHIGGKGIVDLGHGVGTFVGEYRG